MMVEVRLSKDQKMLTYIKMIRSYSQKLSIGELKRRIENNDTVIEFDTSGYDFNDEFTKGMTEDDYHFGFYKFLEELQNEGANLSIYLNHKKADMSSLYQRLIFEKEVRQEVETYPD